MMRLGDIAFWVVVGVVMSIAMVIAIVAIIIAETQIGDNTSDYTK